MLYFVPTPIGNLSDISYHAIEILSDCEVIICEDTRVTKSLLNLLSQKYFLNFKCKEFYSFHTHNEKEFFDKFEISKFTNKICVYVTDAGMPCISDPGISLVRFAQQNNICYEVLSGANAALIAVAASGIVEKEFVFIGFLPNTGRQREIYIQNLMNSLYPSIVYESPKRILNLLGQICNIDKNRKVFLIKEATKKFETKFQGSAISVLNLLKTANLNGEWCAVIDKSLNCGFERITTDDILSLDIAPKIKAKLLSKITGENSKIIYEKIIK